MEVERLTNEATSVVDDCLFRLSNNVEKMGEFVEKLKTLKTEVEAEVPNPPSSKTADVIGEHYAISNPEETIVNNPTRVGNKRNITEKRNAIKGERVREKKHLELKRNKRGSAAFVE